MKIHFCFAAILVLVMAGCSAVRDDGQDTAHAFDGKLYSLSGEELSLWGVNFQPCLSWEYHSRLERHGIPETSEALKKVVDDNLPEVLRMGANAIRCHLTPADFTDADGNQDTDGHACPSMRTG